MKIRILGVNVEIHHQVANDATGYGFMGRFNEVTSRITINRDMSPDIRLATIIHESIHAISDRLELKLTEKQVRGIESGIMSIIHDSASISTLMNYSNERIDLYEQDNCQ